MRSFATAIVIIIRELPSPATELLTKALFLSLLLPCLCQRGPCYRCEEYRLIHPYSRPYEQIRGKCTYPCECSSSTPVCEEGVNSVMDGCECCRICARQKNEQCDTVNICDRKLNLKCIYSTPFSSVGTCKELSPKSTCKKHLGDWTECSTACGFGISFRTANDNDRCELKNETRICQIRPCQWINFPFIKLRHYTSHLSRRTTIRSKIPVKLKDQDNCTSVRTYFPNYCGDCSGEKCCKPVTSITKTIQFECPSGNNVDRKVMWILKCSCDDQYLEKQL